MKATTAIWLIVVAIIAAAVAVFAVSNAQTVGVAFLGWQATPSLALLVIGAFICGGVIVGAISLPGRIRMGLRVRSLERQLAATPPPPKPQPDRAAQEGTLAEEPALPGVSGAPTAGGGHAAGQPAWSPSDLPAALEAAAGGAAESLSPSPADPDASASGEPDASPPRPPARP